MFTARTDASDGHPRTPSTLRILQRMTTPIPTRFTEREIDLIDDLVAQNVGQNRSDVIRRAVHHFADAVRRERVGREIAESYRSRPQSADDDGMAMANALAMTEAEPW